MQRIDGPTRSAALPAPGATGAGSASPGYFASGDPIAGTPPTTVTSDWANAIQEELVGVIEHAGLTPDKGSHTQLLAALQLLFVATGGSTGAGGVTVQGGETTIPLPGGYYLKLGSTTIGSGSNSLTGNIAFVTPFPAGCLLIVGNADGKANGQWGPVAVMIGPADKNGASYIADTANQAQQIAAGRSIRWLAVGN